MTALLLDVVRAALGDVQAAEYLAANRSMSRAEREQALADGRLYHGGAPGLSVGDEVLPPLKTGVLPQPDAHTRVYKNTFVYMTTVQAIALCWAKSYPGPGAVYLVDPVGSLTEHPASRLPLPCSNFYALSAIVREVVQKLVERDSYTPLHLQQAERERRKLPA